MSHYSKEQLGLLKKAQYSSISIATLILTIKFYSWIETDSSSIFSSLVDSLLDLTSSLINFIALRLALMPPDHNHRFGHNKIEDLAVFGQSIFIALSGSFALYASAKHMYYNQTLTNPGSGIYAMIACSMLTIMLVLYQSFVIQKTRSHLIKADKVHYISDLLTNVVVISSLYLSDRYVAIDSIFGIIIACYVIYSSYNLISSSLNNLIDTEFSDSERQKIVDIISGHPEVFGIHEMKTRYAGNKPFIQFHLEMDGKMTLEKAHHISDTIMIALLKEFTGAEIIIHQDPNGLEHNNPYTETLKNR